MTDAHGLFEHADGAVPRVDDGYSLGDNARALIVVCREPRPAPNVAGLTRRYLDFVLAAVQRDGRCHSRMSADGLWTDAPDVGDGWGLAVWSLGVAAIAAESSALQARALTGFRLAAKQRSTQLRAMAFAGLGAAEVFRRFPDDRIASTLLDDAAQTIWWDEDPDDEWHWPEPRLSYANAALAETMLLAGDLLEQDALYSRGLEMLQFLLDTEVHDGRLSVTPVGGRGADDPHTVGEQRPLEVGALADACASAYRITRERRWADGVGHAWSWFLGENDAATMMFDQTTGGGFDALGETGRDGNQGAEATIAMLSTAQHARRMLVRA